MLIAYLADTNVATRRVLTQNPAHGEIKRAVDTLLLRGETVVIKNALLLKLNHLDTCLLTKRNIFVEGCAGEQGS